MSWRHREMEERAVDVPVFQILKEKVSVTSVVSPVLHNLKVSVYRKTGV